MTDPEMAGKIDDFISKLKECMEVKSPFTVVRCLDGGTLALQYDEESYFTVDPR